MFSYNHCDFCGIFCIPSKLKFSKTLKTWWKTYMMIYPEIRFENHESPHQNRPKIRQVDQNRVLSFFGYIIMYVFHQVFRVFENFNFLGMKKIPQR